MKIKIQILDKVDEVEYQETFEDVKNLIFASTVFGGFIMGVVLVREKVKFNIEIIENESKSNG